MVPNPRCARQKYVIFKRQHLNLVPRACDPQEGTRGSGIVRSRKPGILAKIELRIPFQRPIRFLPQKRIIPEPRVPSRGSQARGTRLPTSRQSND